MVNSLDEESAGYMGEIQDVVRHFKVDFGWFVQFCVIILRFEFEKLG